MVVAVATTVDPWSTFTVAPEIGVVPLAAVIFPEIVPVVINVNVTPLLADPPTVTTKGPVVAPEGTGATMFVLLQLEGVDVVPLKVIVLFP